MRSTYKRAVAAATVAALNLAAGAPGALAAAHNTATGSGGWNGAGAPTAGGGASSGTSLTNVVNGVGTNVHAIALIGIAIGLALTAVCAVLMHRWKLMLIGAGLAIGAFFFVNGGAANVANNTANSLASGGAQGAQTTSSPGIPGVSGP